MTDELNLRVIAMQLAVQHAAKQNESLTEAQALDRARAFFKFMKDGDAPENAFENGLGIPLKL